MTVDSKHYRTGLIVIIHTPDYEENCNGIVATVNERGFWANVLILQGKSKGETRAFPLDDLEPCWMWEQYTTSGPDWRDGLD